MLKTLFSAGLWRQVTDRLHQRTRSLEEQTGPRLSAIKNPSCEKSRRKAPPLGLEGKSRSPWPSGEQAPCSRRLRTSLKHWEGIKACCRPRNLLPAGGGLPRGTQTAQERALAAWKETEQGSALLQQKREQAQVLREQAVAVAQEQTQLSQQREELHRAQTARGTGRFCPKAGPG